MVAYYFSFKTAFVKGSPNVVAANAAVLIYDVADVNRATPVTVYSDAGLTTITNLVSDAYGIVPDFYTDNRPDVLWKSGTLKGQWATSQSRPGLRGPQGPQGTQGVQGVQGNPGLDGAGTNAAVAAYIPAAGPTRDALDARYQGKAGLGAAIATEINTPASSSQVAVDARITAASKQASYDSAAAIASVTGDGEATGNRLRKVGVIIDKSAASSYDNLRVESLTTIRDPESGRIAGVYTAYGDSSGAERASIVLTYSDDGLTWDKQGVLLGASGVAGAGDQNGCTGPVLIRDGGTYYLFYIGLTATGYEGGTKTLMLATSPSLKNPVWTRRGVIMSPGGTGWRQKQIWHPNIIRANGKWYCFVNASGSDDKERIGYATADQLTGPWTFDDANSPLIQPGGAEIIAGDPCVTKIPGGWRMDYFTVPATGAFDWYTTTTDAAFPLGWTAHDPANTARQTIAPGPAGSFDELYAHKPWVMRHAGSLFHYYTAVMAGNTNRRIAAAVDGPVPRTSGATGQTATPVSVGAFCQIKSATADTIRTLTAGAAYAYGPTAEARVQARAGDILELTVAYVADNQAGDLRVDAVTLNGATKVNYVSGLAAGGHGVTAWGAIGGRYTQGGGPYHYTVQAADVVSGVVILRPVFKADSNGPRNVLNDGNDPVTFSVRNLC